MSSFMFDLNSVQFDDDDDDSEGSGDEHSEIPARPRTSWDGTNYNRAQFFIQQQSTRRAIQPGAFPPPPQHPQARQFNAKGTQRPTGTPTNRCHCVSEDFYRGITENSELLTLINPSNAIGGEMRAIEQHKQNLSNNSSLFNSSDTTPLMANFSRITPFEDDDTISCSSSSNSNNNFNSGSSMERSGSGSPMFGRRNGGFNNDDNDCCQMRASRSSLDSSIQRRNFIQHYNAYMKGNPNYFALTKGSGILDSDSKVDGYLRLPRNMQQYGNPQNSQQQQQQQQQQHYQQSSQLQNQQTYKSGNTGNVGSSLVNSNGYRWGYAYSVPSRSLNSSGVNSPYYDSYYSSGYASSLSGSSSSVVLEQNEVLDDPRELQKMKDDISRNSAANKHDVSEITAMLDNTHLSQKQQRHPHQRKLSLSSQTSSTSSMTSSFTSSSQFQSQLSPRSTLPQTTSTTGTQKDQPLSPVTSSSSSSAGVVTSSSTNSSSPSPSSSGSSPLQRKQQLVIVKKKLVIQKPKSKTIQQSPLSQNNTNNITQNSDDNSDKPYDNNNSNSVQNVNSNEPLNNINNPQLPLQQQQQQQPQKKKRKHRGGRRGTRVMREAKERKLASLREAKLLEESQQAAIINNNEGDDNDDDDDGDKEENDNETK